MSESFEVGGFVVSLEGEEAVCRFAAPDDFGGELPSSLDQALEAEFAPGGRLAGKKPVVALYNAPAVSSRQLGAMLALHQAAGGQQRVEVRGARRQVRDFFEMTRMANFFEY
jgi:hypothetical protein